MTARDASRSPTRGTERFAPLAAIAPFSGATAGHEAARLFTRTLAHGVTPPADGVGTQPPL